MTDFLRNVFHVWAQYALIPMAMIAALFVAWLVFEVWRDPVERTLRAIADFLGG